MAAGDIQLQTDGSGKRVDANTLTSTEAGTPTVYRQLISIGDPSTFANQATVKAASTAVVATDLPLAVGLHPTSPLPAGSNAIGAVTNTNLDVALSTRLKPADTLAGVTTVTAVTAITNALPAGTNKIGTVDIATAPAVAKGTQGANAVPTQALHDSGRNLTTLFMAIPIITTNAEALMSLTSYKSNAAVGATTTPAVVTTGKTFRIQQILLTYIGTATAGQARFLLRANSGGVVALSSALVAVWEVGQNAAVAGLTETVTLDIGDGMEFPAGTGLGIGMIGVVAPNTATAVGYGQITIIGYEY